MKNSRRESRKMRNFQRLSRWTGAIERYGTLSHRQGTCDVPSSGEGWQSARHLSASGTLVALTLPDIVMGCFCPTAAILVGIGIGPIA
jgi:hypothetical protein